MEGLAGSWSPFTLVRLEVLRHESLQDPVGGLRWSSGPTVDGCRHSSSNFLGSREGVREGLLSGVYSESVSLGTEPQTKNFLGLVTLALFRRRRSRRKFEESAGMTGRTVVPPSGSSTQSVYPRFRV